MRSAFVAIIGRPSAGKSTLINTLCGHKVSIVSPVPQTTRNAIRGIYNESRGQLVFVDTPGYHNSDRKFNKRLTNVVMASLNDTDIILYLVDMSRPMGEEETFLMGMISAAKRPVIVGLNKSDLVAASLSAHSNPALGAGHDNQAEADGEPVASPDIHSTDEHEKKSPSVLLAELKAALIEAIPQATTLEISATNGYGVKELKTALFAAAPEGQEWYPKEYYTDQDPSFRIAEIIREQVMNRTREEVPHAVYIELGDLELRSPSGELLSTGYDSSADWDLPVTKRARLKFRASICVERDSQKGIVVGKGGSLIKAIREASEKQLREIFPWYVELELHVKVAPKWRSDDSLIERMIH